MRSPVPYIPPPLPALAAPVIRDDIALQDIAPSDWNALTGGQPFPALALDPHLPARAMRVPVHVTGEAIAAAATPPRPNPLPRKRPAAATRLKIDRDLVKALALYNRNQLIPCPACGIDTRGANLVRQFDKHY